MFVTFILLCSFQGIIVCEDILIVSLAPDRTDNGYLVYFRIPNLIPTSKDDPLTFSFTNTTSVKELEYDPLVKTLFMIDISSNLYITENFTDDIQTSKLTDNVIETFSSQSSKIAIDWLSKNIYHIDPSYNWITVKSLNAVHSSKRKTLIDGLALPKSIAVDPLNGYLFWSSEHGGRSAIWKSTLCGSNQTLLMSDLLLVTDIVLSCTERRIYWLDIGRETLETCGYDGSNRRVLRRSPSLLMSMSGLTLHKDIICFTVQLAYFVECIDKQTGRTVWQHLFQWPKDGKYEYKIPQALKFIQGTEQDNRTLLCKDKDCEYLCIASKEDGATCMCPDGFTLDERGINCTQNKILHQKSLLFLNSSSICFVDVLVLTGLPIHVECILHWNRSISHFVVDAHQDKICFEDNDDKKLMMLDIKSGLTIDLMSVSGLSGLCVDWINGNIYWSEKNSGLIMFINERFPMEMPVFQNVDHPFSLTIDPLNRTLYWISGTVGTFHIEGGTSDGTQRWTAVNSIHLKHPDGLFVDVTSNRLFWKDVDGVYSMNLENYEIQSFPSISIRSFTKYKNYLLLLKNEGEVRVSDTKVPGIRRRLDMPVFTNAIVYDKSEQPKAKDRCSVRNGDCEHACIPNPDGTRICKCRLGYKMRKDQKSCESLPLQSNFVLTVDFTHATIFQVSMADADVVAIDVNETIRPVNAIFHLHKRNLIYSDAMFREIRQLSMSGHVSVTLTHTGQFEPHALVVEPSTGHLIYSAVSTKSYIGILNIDTKERKTVVPGLTSVYNIAIHPKKGYLFWSDLVYSASYIGRSYLDGSAMINLIFNDISQPNSLTLDYKKDLLYWTDGELSTINYCDLDGGSRGVLLQGSRQKFMQFDISGDHFYYTSLDDQKITKASLSNAKEIKWMSYIADFGKLQSLQAYGENIIPVNDVCSVANGRCSTFCLPSFRHRKCACPDGVKLLADKRTCSGVAKCPEDIPNGRLNSDCAPYIGNNCTWTCNPGFTAWGSSQRISCQGSGTWNVSSLDLLCIKVPTHRPKTDPTNDGAIAGGIVAASLAVTIVLVLIIIFLCRRASDSPSPDSGTIHYTYGGHVNGNLSGTRKGSKVIIEDVPSNSRSSS